MIDVVFLLLIYFIVIQKPLITDTLIEVTMPGESNKPKTSSAPALVINVLEEFKGNPEKDLKYYRLNGTLWPLENIGELLEKSCSGEDGQSLLISCGPNARHEKLVRLLDICGKSKVKKMSIVNDPNISFRPRK
jgi:biopolymer transport protein ExbD